MSDFELHNTLFPGDTPGNPKLHGYPEELGDSKPVGAEAEMRRLSQQPKDHQPSPEETDASGNNRTSDNQTPIET